jgi:alkanesulfonate monooxygenase SsuD/methylene tetrahydromethanopterin reductase-like flavin-dependent oxidoreductase (luciferase family)
MIEGIRGSYGLLLPHFGPHASRENLLNGARSAERYGFRSVWVRDHLVFHPNNVEGDDRTHVEPLVTLAAIAGATENLILGTSSLIPHRHPIHAALSLSSLERVAGPGRVIAGWGIGAFDHEFEAIGLHDVKRGDLLREQIHIIRRLWLGASVSYAGQFYTFIDVDIHPSPASGSLPIWFCGSSALAVRNAVEYCDGWMPGRITIRTFEKRYAQLERLSDEHGLEARPIVATTPIVSPGTTRKEALRRVDWRALLQQAAGARLEPPASGSWTSPDDLDGYLIAGSAAEIIDAAARYRDAGLDHLVFDLRLRFDGWLDHIAFLGEEVLPHLMDPGSSGQHR